MSKHKMYIEIGDAIRSGRKRKGIRQKELASSVGTCARYLRRIENAEVNPTLDVVCELLLALGLVFKIDAKREGDECSSQ